MGGNIVYDLNNKEKEICAFLSALEIINHAVNKVMLNFSGQIANITIQANGIAEEKLFLALNADLLARAGSIRPETNMNLIEWLRSISDYSLLSGTELKELKQASQNFLDWLDEKSSYSNIYFPSKNLNLSLDISNRNVISICGNSAKHNLTHLDQVRKALRDILVENHLEEIIVTNKDLIFLLQEFNDNFRGDNGYIAKYINCMAYFMNELRWAIYYSLKPVFDNHYVGKKINGLEMYEFLEPEGLSNEGFSLFRELMEEQYNKPHIPRFNILDIWLKTDTYVFDQRILDEILKN